MKTLTKKLLGAACLMAAAITLTSCLSSNGDDVDTTVVPLTPAEKAQQINAMSGTYTGRAILFTIQSSGLTKSDSADIHFVVRADSSIAVMDFPLKLFTWYASNTAIKTALSSVVAPFTANFQLYSPMNYVKKFYNYNYFFTVWPYGQNYRTPWNVSFPYTFNGAAQNMTVTLSADYAAGYQNAVVPNMYVVATREIQFFLLPSQILLGDGTTIAPQRSFITIRGKK